MIEKELEEKPIILGVNKRNDGNLTSLLSEYIVTSFKHNTSLYVMSGKVNSP